jgi:uncharacterized protein
MISEKPVSGDDIFSCKNCGECCQGFGGTYVTPENIQNIAAYLGIHTEHLIKEYCRPSGSKTVLAQKPDGYCVFWDKNCTIHPVKPRMCRAWPFIQNILKEPGNWGVMANSCPGMKPDIPEPILIARVQKEIGRLDNS